MGATRPPPARGAEIGPEGGPGRRLPPPSPAVRLLLALGGLLTAGCGESAPPPDAGDLPDADTGRAARPVAARYVTTLAFASEAGVALHASFENETSAEHLVRRYRAWLHDGAGWRPLLAVHDTLPVPRAAWRLLPADSLRLAVGDGAEIVSLAFGRGAGAVRLRAGEELGRWTGATGQREALGLAVLEKEGSAIPGVLFFRRAARSGGLPARGDLERIFLLADSLGNGLLLQSDASSGGTAAARTWLHGGLATWTQVELRADPGADSVPPPAPLGGTLADRLPAAWAFEIPQAGLRGRLLRAGETPGDSSVGRRAFRVRGRLFVDADVFRFEGVGLEIPLP